MTNKNKILRGDIMNKFDKSNFVIDKVVDFKICGKCPSCNEFYEHVKYQSGIFGDPHFCPHCNYDLFKHNLEVSSKKTEEIEQNEYCQLHYDLRGAYEYGVKIHPQEQMQKLGYKVIGSVPQSIGDCWWFTVEEFVGSFPPYLSKMKYNYEYWHENCWKNCEYFKENSSCCFGGNSCKKNT
jgi:hypothetical protein